MVDPLLVAASVFMLRLIHPTFFHCIVHELHPACLAFMDAMRAAWILFYRHAGKSHELTYPLVISAPD